MAETRYKEPAGADKAGPLTLDEVKDTVTEKTPKAPPPPPAPKRVRAKPFAGGTTIVIRDIDFARGGIKHRTVEWDFRRDHFTLPVGKGGIDEKAAEYLVNNFPGQFEYA